MNKLISIICPIYNSDLYLKECLDSILHQSYINFELILIDDGSTDRSGKICDEYAAKDNRISVIHQTNSGQSAARNKGIDIASGEYITFLDADDWIDSETISHNISILNENPQIDFIQYPISKKVQQRKGSCITTIEERFRKWLIEHSITNYVCDKIFRRDIFLNLRFKENMYYEDRYLMCSILAKSNKIYFSDYGMYHYRTHAAQTTQKPYSPFVLQSLITADLNIVKHIVPYPSLYNVLIERYSNCLHYFNIIQKHQWQLEQTLKDELQENIPTWKHILSSQVPIGIKIRCIGAKLLGVTNYVQYIRY